VHTSVEVAPECSIFISAQVRVRISKTLVCVLKTTSSKHFSHFFFVKSFFASAGVFRRKIFCEKQPVLEMVSASLFYEGSEENVS
jgi:hypothetical protein